MYIHQIFIYLLWPVLIIASWLAIKIALSAYEKKYPDSTKKEEQQGHE